MATIKRISVENMLENGSAGEISVNDAFGRDFSSAMRSDWSEYYIDYSFLIEFLSRIKERRAMQRRVARLRRRQQSQSSSYLSELIPDPDWPNMKESLNKRLSDPGYLDGFLIGISPSTTETGELFPLSDQTKDKNGDNRLRLNSWSNAPDKDKSSDGDAWSLQSVCSDSRVPLAASALRGISGVNDQAAFCALLDDQLEKVGFFFLKEQGRLATEVAKFVQEDRAIRSLMPLCGQHSDDGDVDGAQQEVEWEVAVAVHKSLEGCRHVGADLLELFHFVAINMTALRKVLDRHDAIVRRYRGRSFSFLGQTYIAERTEEGNSSHVKTLLEHNGLLALAGSLKRCVADLKLREAKIARKEITVFTEKGLLAVEPFVCDIDTVATKMKDAEKRSVQDYVVGGSLGNNLDLEPSVLQNRFFHAKNQDDTDMHYFATVRRLERMRHDFKQQTPSGRTIAITGGLVGAELDIDREEQSKLLEEDKFKVWPIGLQLNLFSTLLYMTNYFIAGPTSVMYMEALGGQAALASMVIGATPWAVTVSTVLFSVWSNYSFKRPLLFSGLLLCLGNLLYALALKFDSVGMVMAGRMITGLGSPRVINRRYIADTATMSQRTAVSAAFVTFSAAGTAVGPGLSILLQKFDTSFKVPFFGVIILNGLTAPGYCMFVIWLIFLCIMIFLMEEPIRIGLQQQPIKSKDSTVGSNEDLSLLSMEGNENDTMHDNISKDPERTEEEKLLASQNPNTGYGSASNAHAEFESAFDKRNDSAREEEDSDVTTNCCIRGMTWPVLMCMFLLFVNKLSIESLISSSPVITDARYDWTVHQIGSLGLAIGLLVIPLSICIGWLSRRYEDGKLLIWLIYFTMVGQVLLFDFNDFFGQSSTKYGLLGVGPHRYVYGCLFSFSGLQAMESIIMSTLSKVVPYTLALGTCNSGLINTEVGTIGRAVGDSLVTFLGLFDIENLLDLVIAPLLLLMIGCIVLVKINHDVFKA